VEGLNEERERLRRKFDEVARREAVRAEGDDREVAVEAVLAFALVLSVGLAVFDSESDEGERVFDR